MQENFDAAIAAVWQFDGIKEDDAPGENFHTAYGITEMTWNDAVRQGVVHGGFGDITPADAKTILRMLYWNKTGCPLWPAGVDLMVFDFAMMAGNGASIRTLQQAVATDDDGVIGPNTRSKVLAARPMILIDALRQYHLTFLMTLHNWPTFKGGWTRRQVTMQAWAEAMQARHVA